MWETWVWSPGWEDPLEKEMATHSNTLAWKIPWMEEPDRLQSKGTRRVGHDWAASLPLPCLQSVNLMKPLAFISTLVLVNSDLWHQADGVRSGGGGVRVTWVSLLILPFPTSGSAGQSSSSLLQGQVDVWDAKCQLPPSVQLQWGWGGWWETRERVSLSWLDEGASASPFWPVFPNLAPLFLRESKKKTTTTNNNKNWIFFF